MTSEAIPAATLVLFRDRPGLPPELLIVERAGSMAFAAGALVFPGGRIDPGDRAMDLDRLITTTALDADEAAARIAAIRETIEESGIGPALLPPPSPATIADLRARLHEGEAFGALLVEHQLRLDLDALIPFARWRPNFKESRSFDTRFYIARVPADAPEPIVDATENVATFWAAAADIIAACDRGEHRVIFPTRRNLERLAKFDDFAAASEDAARHPVETITPWIEERGGVRTLCIPEDRGYPVTHEVLAAVMRG